MEYYSPKWSSDDKPVEGQQLYSLPMMTCPECGNHRGNTSVHYPWLDLDKIFPAAIEKRLRNGRAKDFTWEEFVEVRKEIRRHLTSDLPLPPTAEFGSFVGKIFAKPAATDFVLTVSFKLLARRNVVVELKTQGFDLQFFETVLKQQKGREEDYVQVYPAPAGSGGQVLETNSARIVNGAVAAQIHNPKAWP